MDRELKKIAADKTSGSTDILLKLVPVVKKHMHDTIALNQILDDAEKLFTPFGNIMSYLKNLRKAVKSGDDLKIEKSITAPLQAGEMFGQIYKNAESSIRNVRRIFTFSDSSTLREIISLHSRKSKKQLTVFICESRPKNEGRLLAKKLLALNLNVEFGIDAMMAEMISRCDAVFLGCDKLLKNGDVVNKTGSLAAAVTADYYKKPVYVFADSSKRSSKFNKENRNISEVWNKKNNNLTVHNYYFEAVPAELITKIFTEKR